MRYWYFLEPVFTESGAVTDDNIVIMSEDDIVREYGPHYIRGMLGQGRTDEVNKEDLIQDWVVVNWAVLL